MKKLLGIVVLGLLLSGNAYAELITLTKCYILDLQETGGNEIYSYKNWKQQTHKIPIGNIDTTFRLKKAKCEND